MSTRNSRIDLTLPASPADCTVMGILNITPDSFSDGGRWSDVDAALAHAHQMVAQGADIIDVGGESTRPGAQRVTPQVELDRVLPIVQALHQDGICVSVDTMRASTAQAVIEAGADLINDVSAGLYDPDIRHVVAEAGLPYVLMHWHTQNFGDAATDVDPDLRVDCAVVQDLTERVDDALSAGINEDNLIVDPGLGFAKTRDQDWSLLHNLSHLQDMGYPILLGASRKRFIGELMSSALPDAYPQGTEPDQRDEATALISLLAAHSGVWCVRVHNVAATRLALSIGEAWMQGRNPYHPTAEGIPAASENERAS